MTRSAVRICSAPPFHAQKKPAGWRAFELDYIAETLKFVVQANEVFVHVWFNAHGISSIRVGETRPESMPVLEGYVDFVTEVVRDWDC